MFCIFRRFVEIVRLRRAAAQVRRASRACRSDGLAVLKIELITRLLNVAEEINSDGVVSVVNEAVKPNKLQVDAALGSLAQAFARYQIIKQRMNDDGFADAPRFYACFRNALYNVFSPPEYKGARERLVSDVASKIGVFVTRLRPNLVYCVILIA